MYEKGFWVFGYGSLLWRPGFSFAERKRASLAGFRRAFCMYSVTYRGTPQNPGLVLALDPVDAARCEGVAYKVSENHAVETLAYLRERELVTSAYVEQSQNITLECGARVDAICYVIDRGHAQYTGPICLETQADIIARSSGDTGPNWEYLFNTTDHLAEIGIQDTELETLAKMVRKRRLAQPLHR